MEFISAHLLNLNEDITPAGTKNERSRPTCHVAYVEVSRPANVSSGPMSD